MLKRAVKCTQHHFRQASVLEAELLVYLLGLLRSAPELLYLLEPVVQIHFDEPAFASNGCICNSCVQICYFVLRLQSDGEVGVQKIYESEIIENIVNV